MIKMDIEENEFKILKRGRVCIVEINYYDWNGICKVYTTYT